MTGPQGSSTLSELRIGVVGAGHIASEHLKVLKAQKDVKLPGIFTRTRARAEALACSFDQLIVYDTLEKLVHDGRVDALLVLVSADQIYSVVKGLCRCGIPLFIEKPPGLSPKETKEHRLSHHELASLVCHKQLTGQNCKQALRPGPECERKCQTTSHLFGL